MKNKKLFFILPFILLGGLFLLFLYHSLIIIDYPFIIDEDESYLFPAADFIHNGELPYMDIYKDPFFYTNEYPPVYSMITAAFFPLFGKKIIIGRIISLISTTLISIIAYKIIKQKTKNKILSIFGFLVTITSYFMFMLARLYKVDALAMFFTILGIYFILNHTKKNNIYLAALSFILAFYTKQTFIAAPIASFIFIFIKNKRKSIRFAISYIIPLTFTLILLTIITKGQYFLHTIVYTAQLGKFYFGALEDFIILFPILILLTIYYITTNIRNILSIYFLTAIITNLLQLSKIGASTYYLFELSIILTIISCISINILLKKGQKNPIMVASYSQIIIIILALFQIISLNNNMVVLTPLNTKDIINKNLFADNKINKYVINATGNVLIQEPIYNVLNDKKINFESWVLWELQTKKIVTKQEFYNYCKKQNFSLIAYYDEFDLIEGFKECLNIKYKKIETIPKISFVYGKTQNWSIYKK